MCMSSTLAKAISVTMETATDVHTLLMALTVVKVMIDMGNPHSTTHVKKSIERSVDTRACACACWRMHVPAVCMLKYTYMYLQFACLGMHVHAMCMSVSECTHHILWLLGYVLRTYICDSFRSCP